MRRSILYTQRIAAEIFDKGG